MENWNELRTAYLIGVHGTATGAAKALGVHRTTVIRQIDALEKHLQQKLFIRHSRGFTLNEAGEELLHALKNTELQLSTVLNKLKDRHFELSGELVITSIERAFFYLSDPLDAFLTAYPNVRIRYEASPHKYSLEFGEAHIAIRPGPKPQQPDYIVQRLFSARLAMYANKKYIARYGVPNSEHQFSEHRFVVSALPVSDELINWFKSKIPIDNIVLESMEPSIGEEAIAKGMGIGLMRQHYAAKIPELVEILPNRPEWTVPIWLVTHKDQHKLPKVKACLGYLKKWAQENDMQ